MAQLLHNSRLKKKKDLLSNGKRNKGSQLNLSREVKREISFLQRPDTWGMGERVVECLSGEEKNKPDGKGSAIKQIRIWQKLKAGL